MEKCLPKLMTARFSYLQELVNSNRKIEVIYIPNGPTWSVFIKIYVKQRGRFRPKACIDAQYQTADQPSRDNAEFFLSLWDDSKQQSPSPGLNAADD